MNLKSTQNNAKIDRDILQSCTFCDTEKMFIKKYCTVGIVSSKDTKYWNKKM